MPSTVRISTPPNPRGVVRRSTRRDNSSIARRCWVSTPEASWPVAVKRTISRLRSAMRVSKPLARLTPDTRRASASRASASRLPETVRRLARVSWRLLIAVARRGALAGSAVRSVKAVNKASSRLNTEPGWEGSPKLAWARLRNSAAVSLAEAPAWARNTLFCKKRSAVRRMLPTSTPPVPPASTRGSNTASWRT